MSDIMEDWGISAPQQFQYGLSISNWQFPGYWPHISTKKLNNLNRVHQTNSYTISYIFILQTISYISVFSARILAMLPVVPCMPLIIPVQHGWVEWGAPLVDSDTGRMFVRGEQCFSIIHTHYLVNYDSITQVCPSIESNSCWHTSDVKKSRTTNWNWECYSSVHSSFYTFIRVFYWQRIARKYSVRNLFIFSYWNSLVGCEMFVPSGLKSLFW